MSLAYASVLGGWLVRRTGRHRGSGGYDLAATADHREFWRVEGRAERGSGSARRELR